MGTAVGVLELWSFQRLFYFAWSDIPIGMLIFLVVSVMAVSAALVVTINTRLAFTEEGPSS